jgi:hypothetical protein
MGLDSFVNGHVPVSELEQSHHELRRLVNLSDEVLGSEGCVTRELQQLLQLSMSVVIAPWYRRLLIVSSAQRCILVSRTRSSSMASSTSRRYAHVALHLAGRCVQP